VLDHDLSLRSTYGCGDHSCEHCGARGKALEPITARVAHVTTHLREGDLCCTSCRTGLRQDADAIDAMVLDRETAAQVAA
jgi:hypothetical protein